MAQFAAILQDLHIAEFSYMGVPSRRLAGFVSFSPMNQRLGKDTFKEVHVQIKHYIYI